MMVDDLFAVSNTTNGNGDFRQLSARFFGWRGNFLVGRGVGRRGTNTIVENEPTRASKDPVPEFRRVPSELTTEYRRVQARATLPARERSLDGPSSKAKTVEDRTPPIVLLAATASRPAPGVPDRGGLL
jgi:hypothetical protein